MRWPWTKRQQTEEPDKVKSTRLKTEKALEDHRRALEDAARVGIIDLEADTYQTKPRHRPAGNHSG